jgi:ribosome maturation factor RimP
MKRTDDFLKLVNRQVTLTIKGKQQSGRIASVTANSILIVFDKKLYA